MALFFIAFTSAWATDVLNQYVPESVQRKFIQDSLEKTLKGSSYQLVDFSFSHDVSFEGAVYRVEGIFPGVSRSTKITVHIKDKSGKILKKILGLWLYDSVQADPEGTKEEIKQGYLVQKWENPTNHKIYYLQLQPREGIIKSDNKMKGQLWEIGLAPAPASALVNENPFQTVFGSKKTKVGH